MTVSQKTAKHLLSAMKLKIENKKRTYVLGGMFQLVLPSLYSNIQCTKTYVLHSGIASLKHHRCLNHNSHSAAVVADQEPEFFSDNWFKGHRWVFQLCCFIRARHSVTDSHADRLVVLTSTHVVNDIQLFSKLPGGTRFCTLVPSLCTSQHAV